MHDVEPAAHGSIEQTGSAEATEELMVSLQRLGRLLASRQATSRVTTAAGADVTMQGAALLRVMLREGRTSVAALAAAAPMDLGAVSRQVRLLAADGLVRRSGAPDDGRVALLELTPEGRKLAQRMRAVGCAAPRRGARRLVGGRRAHPGPPDPAARRRPHGNPRPP